MTYPGAQILSQAVSWEKFSEIRMKSVAMTSHQPHAIPSSAHPGSLPALAGSSQPKD